jgi:hypothetical protein
MADAAADYPRAWEIDVTFEFHKANEGDSDEEDDGSDAEEATKEQPASGPIVEHGRSPAFADFLQFLELGCGGLPLQGYPAVLVILSSIPSSVRTHLSQHPISQH